MKGPAIRVRASALSKLCNHGSFSFRRSLVARLDAHRQTKLAIFAADPQVGWSAVWCSGARVPGSPRRISSTST
jgi:hypothetical protein